MKTKMNLLLVCLVAIALSFAACGSQEKKTETKDQNTTSKITYICTMHPEVVSDKPGKCSKCGMELVEKKADNADQANKDTTNAKK